MTNRTMLLVAVLASASMAVGCTNKKKDQAPGFDADAKSGPDSKRSGAVPIPINVVVTDEVNYEQQDQTDWKSVELKGKPGILQVDLHWDNANADLNVDVFNSYGEQIAASPGPQPGAQTKKVPAQIETLGVYFIRIQAVKRGDGSVYTVEAKWEGEAVPAVVEPTPVVKDPPKRKDPVVRRDPSPPKKKSFDPDRGVQGRVVSSYREGGKLKLHIDKGSAAGVKVGSNGAVLDGPSGANPLEGGSFTITQVIDESKSVGETDLKSIGRNTRVSINVK